MSRMRAPKLFRSGSKHKIHEHTHEANPYEFSVQNQSNYQNDDFNLPNDSRFDETDLGPMRAPSARPTMDHKPSLLRQEPLRNIPDGQVFQDGAHLLKSAPSYEVYKPKEVYLDKGNPSGGKVSEVNGDLYAYGQRPVIKYEIDDQIVRPNSHLTAKAKNTEADMRLQEANKHHSMMPQNQPSGANDLPIQLMTGSLIGALVGYLRGSTIMTLGSLAAGLGTSYVFSNQMALHSPMAQPDFAKRMAAIM